MEARRALALSARFGVVALCLVGAIASTPSEAAHPNALWHVVHDLCVADMKASGLPTPCEKVDLAGGWAVLKDIRGATQLLLIPTARNSGIDSPKVLAPGSPNYWQAAWEARTLFDRRVGRTVPRDDIGLAINSVYARSQNQLHIHIDCVRADVRDALWSHESEIGPDWSELAVKLAELRYRVMRLEGPDLGARDPFKLLAEGEPDARADMGAETLAVIPTTFVDGSPGFILLSHHADLGGKDLAAGEGLLDHRCAVLGR